MIRTVGTLPERGSTSVLVAGACVMVLFLGLGAVLVAAAAQAAAQARTAADLSALGAAQALVDGLAGSSRAEPCSRAVEIAGSNGAEVRRCVIDGGVNVTVQVQVSVVTGWLAERFTAVASARAGPAP